MKTNALQLIKGIGQDILVAIVLVASIRVATWLIDTVNFFQWGFLSTITGYLSSALLFIAYAFALLAIFARIVGYLSENQDQR